MGLLVLGVPSAQAAPSSPLKVTLTASPCPIGFSQGSVALKAQVTGGYQPGVGHLMFVVNRYTFSAQTAGGASTVIKKDSPDATVSWIPNLPGSYIVSVTAKQLQGGAVAQATAQAECEVKKLAYQVTLNVTPPSGQAQAPPPTGQRMIVSASVSPAMPNATNAFSFVVQKMNSSVVALTTVRVNRSDASWPADPPQPADPGLYRIAVQVVGFVTFPQGDVVVAEGQKEINYYEAKAAKALANVGVHTGDPTMVALPVASQVSFTVDPLPPPPVTGSINMKASVVVPGNPSGVNNRFTFSFLTSSGAPVLQYVGSMTPATSATQVATTQNIVGFGGTYTLVASVETRRITDNALVAQGSAQVANYVVASATYPFGWVYPVTTQNATPGVGTRFGIATNTIAGHNIHDIVNKSDIKVRDDNTSCAQCHGGSWSKDVFCVKAPGYSQVGPHSVSGTNSDSILNSVFIDWRARNCPQ